MRSGWLVAVVIAALLLVGSPWIVPTLTDALVPDPSDAPIRRSPLVQGDEVLLPWMDLSGAPAWISEPPGSIDGCFPPGGPVAGPEGSNVTPAFLNRVAAIVEELRDLRFIDEVEPQFLEPDEFDERIRSVGEGGSEDDFAALQDVFAMLGLLEESRDLKQIVEDDLTGQIIGFYLPAEKELYVKAREGGKLSPLEEVTLAHELEHALADQVLGLPLEEAAPPMKGDEQAAMRALIEGDASLLTQHYLFRAFDIAERSALAGDPAVTAGEPDEIPHFLQRSLTFPYEEGVMFVCELYRRGGWRAVDAAYLDPPVSTAQIMYPMRYLRNDEPISVTPLEPPGKGWKRGRPGVLSAADLLFLFEHPGTGSGEWRGRDDAFELAALWGGGRLDHWTKDEETVIGISLAQHQGYPIAAICPVMTDWYAAARPESVIYASGIQGERVRAREPGQVALFLCDAAGMKIAIAPSEKLALEMIEWD
ncbi:MAG TPA: hypothetical protein VNC78_09785 [Actinomycetota bacterium]|nr:hypothetical protein [Actinomycetota bacterium]